MKYKNVKLNEQMKLYISSRNVYNLKSISNSDRIPCDVKDEYTDQRWASQAVFRLETSQVK